MTEIRLVKLGAWSCVLLLAVLSLIPKEIQANAGATGWKVHGIAYFGTMVAWAVGYGNRIDLTRPALALSTYAAFLEIAQHLSPGRTPRFVDFVGGVGGVLVALAIAKLPLLHHRLRPGTI